MDIYPTPAAPTLFLAPCPATPTTPPYFPTQQLPPLSLEHSNTPNHICLGVAEMLFHLAELSQSQNFSKNFTRHLRAKLQKHKNKYRVFLQQKS